MRYVRLTDTGSGYGLPVAGSPFALTGDVKTPEGVTVPRQSIEAMSDADLVSIGFARLDPQSAPAGQSSLGTYTDELVNSVVVRTYDTEDDPLQASTRISDAKAEANRRVGLLFGGLSGLDLVWKEVNVTARGLKLSNSRHGRPLSPEEQAEADALEAAFDAVQAIRDASEVLETEIAGMTHAELVALDVTTWNGWPA